MQNEREINLGDLIIYVLSKWKWLLLACAAGLILVGGYKFYKAEQARKVEPEKQSAYQAAQKTVLDKEEALLNLKNQRAALDVQEENNVMAGKRRDLNREKTNQLQNYLSESILMNINADAVPRAYRIYQVSFDLEPSEKLTMFIDPQDELVAAYGAAIRLDEETAAKYSVPVKYINELISVGTNNTSNTITVSAYGETLEMAESILNDACAVLESRKKDITKRYQEHDLKAVQETSGESVDTSLSTLQKQRYDQLNAYLSQAQTTIATAEELAVKKAALDLDIEEAETALAAAEKAAEAAVLKAGGSIKTGMKYGLIGGVAFAVLLAFLFLLIYIFDGRIHTAKDLADCYGIPLLAALSAPFRKGCRLDRCFYRLRNKGYGTSNEVVIQTASVTIRKLLDNAKTAAVLSSLDEQALESVVSTISDNIQEVRFTAVADSNISAEAAEKLKAVDAVIIYEKRDISRIREIDAELRQARLMEKNIVGCIVG